MRKCCLLILFAGLAGCGSPQSEAIDKESKSTKYQYDLSKERAWLKSEDYQKCLIKEEKYKKDYQTFLKASAKWKEDTKAAEAKKAAADKAYAEYEAKQENWKVGDKLLVIPPKFSRLPVPPKIPDLVMCGLAPKDWTPED